MLKFRDNDSFPSLKDIYIAGDEKNLAIFFGGNGDLYFDIYCEEEDFVTFNILKDSEAYPYFSTLIDDIINCNVYDNKKLNDLLRRGKENKELLSDGKIIWYSDSTYNENANVLVMEKTNEGIKLDFSSNSLDPIFGFGIRICNSGSKYKPFNLCFMELYNSMQELVNVNSKDGGIQKTKA